MAGITDHCHEKVSGYLADVIHYKGHVGLVPFSLNPLRTNVDPTGFNQWGSHTMDLCTDWGGGGGWAWRSSLIKWRKGKIWKKKGFRMREGERERVRGFNRIIEREGCRWGGGGGGNFHTSDKKKSFKNQ